MLVETMSIMHSCSEFAPSIDSAKYRTELLLSRLADSVLTDGLR